MRTANETLNDQFLEMRWRCLSLAADLDRITASPGGDDVSRYDARFEKLQQALKILIDSNANRAEKIQMLFSDASKASEVK
jgi:hypothetical protein